LSNNSFIIVIIIIIIIPKRGGLEAGVHFVFDQDLGPAEGRLWREKREKRGERGEEREERREKRGERREEREERREKRGERREGGGESLYAYNQLSILDYLFGYIYVYFHWSKLFFSVVVFALLCSAWICLQVGTYPLA